MPHTLPELPAPQSQLAIYLVANKWRLAVIHALSTGTLRYGEIHRALGAISHKMLAQTLRGLERDGLLARHHFSEIPPKVEYSLTSLGESLREPLRQLCHWAQDHAEEIRLAQERFDQTHNVYRDAAPLIELAKTEGAGKEKLTI